MIASLSIPERQVGLMLTIGVAILGLVMLGAAKEGPMAVHGAMALLLGIVLPLRSSVRCSSRMRQAGERRATTTNRPASGSC